MTKIIGKQMRTNIPKLARNKYNYVKGADGNHYITQSQYATGGSGGGGGNGTNIWTIQQQQKIESMMNERGVLTNDNITYLGYATQSYVETYYASQSYLETYYASKTYVNTECEAVKEAAYAYTASKEVDLSSYITKQDVETILTTYYDTDDAVDNKVAASTRGSIEPSVTNAYTLGSSSYQYSAVYTYNLYINGVDIKTFVQNIIAEGRV